MKALLRRLHARLSSRPDSEHQQALVRIVILGLVLAYVCITPADGGSTDSAPLAVVILVALGFIVGGIIFAWLLTNLEASHPRRILGMVTDYGLMCAGMAAGGEALSWVYVILLWVTVGNGLRFGNRYLYAGMAMATLAFSVVLITTSYWQQNLILGIGLLVGLIAVPLYLSSLLHSLRKATDDARRANEAKTRFLANMSHEFRTPLNGITGMSQMLASTRLTLEQLEYLDTIQASSRSLLALVEDVLDISAIEAGKFKSSIQQFKLLELLQEVESIVQPIVREKKLAYGLEIAEEVPREVRGDLDHVRQVLLNLVGNAAKFTEVGSIALEITRSKSDSGRDWLLFSVRDTGIGVPLSAQAKLFEAFEQADVGLGRRHGGSGLGTTIAKGLTEALGGRIGFTSTPGQGSCFWVELPFECVEHAATIVEVSLPSHPASGDGVSASSRNVIAFDDPFLRHRARVGAKHILIADDHAANRMVIERVLQKAGHLITTVESGEALLDFLEAGQYDLVITDLHMPDFTGLDLLKHIQVMEAGIGRRTPVVVFSADVTRESIARCKQAGALAFLAKPLVIGNLLEILADLDQTHARKNWQSSQRPALAGAQASPLVDCTILEELRQLGIEENFTEKYFTQCTDDAQQCFSALKHASMSRDWNAAREHAHALKGVAANIGISRCAQECEALMKLADWTLEKESPEWISAIERSLRSGKQQLEAKIAEWKRAGDSDGAGGTRRH